MDEMDDLWGVALWLRKSPRGICNHPEVNMFALYKGFLKCPYSIYSRIWQGYNLMGHQPFLTFAQSQLRSAKWSPRSAWWIVEGLSFIYLLGDDSLLDLPYSGLSSSMNWESRSSPGLTGMTLRFLKKPQWRFDAGAKHEWGDDGDSSIGQGIHRFFLPYGIHPQFMATVPYISWGTW